MRVRYVVLLAVITAAYIVCAYGVLYYLPHSGPEAEDITSLPGGFAKAFLISSSEDSIRSGGVTLLAGSALGIAGLVGFLSFSSGRRDAERSLRKSQDDLFTSALAMIGSEDVSVSTGAIALLESVALSRTDLREVVASTLFTLIRGRIRVDEAVSFTAAERGIALLCDRDSRAGAALRILGQSSGAYSGRGPGAIVERRLDSCDLRRWEVTGARYELVTFSGSYLWDTSFVDCEFVKCVFTHADWTGARLRDVYFNECDLKFSNLTSASGVHVVARKCLGIEADSRPIWMIIES